VYVGFFLFGKSSQSEWLCINPESVRRSNGIGRLAVVRSPGGAWQIPWLVSYRDSLCGLSFRCRLVHLVSWVGWLACGFEPTAVALLGVLLTAASAQAQA